MPRSEHRRRQTPPKAVTIPSRRLAGSGLCPRAAWAAWAEPTRPSLAAAAVATDAPGVPETPEQR
ncbi:MAG: hypothetical protein AVDCRST_MAG49-313 [uncultured Thermomicrobiales bacterium]|uniref:Uncharacterized protein n=1 Tax=uncultured Thermomicrobiales bacterium TaxID=1645740 RepID=A0A6J4U158_9BACT|nr:MAG: hypothetical protein AVDCRST_MAG49-313 [uncultured Thermomicrobiales bacterium]